MYDVYSPMMTIRATLKSLRLPAPLARVIALEAQRGGRSFSAVATEMLEESARTRRFRHIAFAGPPGRRRASIAGTGLDVWEVAREYAAAERSLGRLARAIPWVPREKLAEALAYADVYGAEIAERLEQEAAWTEESVREAMPWSRPRERKA
jgi:uncharacterized protein (DUF433 family)